MHVIQVETQAKTLFTSTAAFSLMSVTEQHVGPNMLIMLCYLSARAA